MAGLWLRTGNVNVTNANAVVNGGSSSPMFVTNNVLPGYLFKGPDNALYEVLSVQSETQLTLQKIYGGSTLSNQAYEILQLTAAAEADTKQKINTLLEIFRTTAELATLKVGSPTEAAAVAAFLGTLMSLENSASTRFRISKGATGNDVYLEFAVGLSGRARIGLIGNNNVVFQTSADGSAWTTCQTIDTSGNVTLGTPLPVASGGTGATTASAARPNLGLGSSDVVTHRALGVGGDPAQFPQALLVSPSTHASSRRAVLTLDNWQIIQDTLADGTLKNLGFWSTALGGFTIDMHPTTGVVDLIKGQLKFPATQNASSNVNTLDDYEEGTWTPTITINASAAGITYTTQTGRYIKIGKVVHVVGTIVLLNKGASSGNVRLASLPFTSGGTVPGGGHTYYHDNCASLTGAVALYVDGAAATALMTTGGAAAAGILTQGSLTNTSRLEFILHYEAST